MTSPKTGRICFHGDIGGYLCLPAKPGAAASWKNARSLNGDILREGTEIPTNGHPMKPALVAACRILDKLQPG